MPYSSLEGKAWAITQLQTKFSSQWRIEFLDVGCGAGQWLTALKPWWPKSLWSGVEVWKPYYDQFELPARYDVMFEEDIRKTQMPFADVIILGDVLEHMTRDESVALWDTAVKSADSAVIGSVPIIHYPQGAYRGNPYEKHVQDHLTVDDIHSMFDVGAMTVGQTVATWIYWT